jgi:uncharacterized protein (TIGR02680 family)
VSTALPEPERERWQPLRAGLVDLVHYDQEEFHFRDGRLLLRGNNGTGKSKVLALTLPFLLDGEISPHRVEPDADPGKRMEWNLLLGGEHPHDERLGYSWLELGRRDADGGARFCTLGCGLKAVRGRGVVAHWHFVTERRIGEQLALVDATGVALTRERLEEALGADGVVHRTARAYRRAVDEALFGLGETRYAALIDLLIRVRAPQLSKRPSEAALSGALTEALPPPDQALIADVAEAFRSLEEDRAALEAMEEARDAAGAYLATYRRYAQIASRRQAARVRRAQAEHDRVTRERSEAQAAQAAALAALQAAERTLAEHDEARGRMQARAEALRESPEARSARELERAAQAVRTAERDTEHAERTHAAAEQQQARWEQQRDAAERERDAAATVVEQLRRQALATAEAALIGAGYRGRVDGLLGSAVAPGEPDMVQTAGAAEREPGETQATAPSRDPAVDAAEMAKRASDTATALIDAQARAVAHVRELGAAAREREHELAAARTQADALAANRDELATRRADAGSALADSATALTRRAREWIDATHVIVVADPSQTVAALELWTETLEGANPLRMDAEQAARAAGAALAREDAELESSEREQQQRATELGEAIGRLEAGEHAAPPDPHTRGMDAREQKAGAPLWQLVDFHDAVDKRDRAGIEAALEAAGILDAWVGPDGTLLAAGADDVLLAPGDDERDGADTASRRLDALLRPAIDAGDARAGTVGAAAVARILAAIGAEEGTGTVWVDVRGTFRNGVLRGAWGKPAAAFIGHGARETARRERLAAMRAEQAQVGRERERIAAERERVAVRQARLADELGALPADDELRTRHSAIAALNQERRRLDERAVAVAAALEQARTAYDEAGAALREAAAELHLAVETEQMDAVERQLAELRLTLASLWPAIGADATASAALTRAAAELAERTREAHELGERARDLRRRAVAAEERHATLRETVGAAVAELQRQLNALAKQLEANEQARIRADEVRGKAQREEGKQSGRLEQLERELAQAAERRREQVDALRRFVATGLPAVALERTDVPDLDQEWTVTAAVRLARDVEQELADAAPDGDEAWARAQRRVNEELGALGDALRRHGNNASALNREEGITVSVVFNGRTTTVPALAAALAQEVEQRERLLGAREREVLENHLVGEVAGTLQELIADAEEQVRRMNTELADRPTSTGMRLRLRWRLRDDGPQGLAAARERLLRQSSDAWSEDDRAAVGAFLHARIKEVRARDEADTWQEQLAEAFDYRRWHHFIVQRRQGGEWRSATGPASGGERVLAATVPLFAAASSHYASASNPHAPRLVMLDEAFAGVDDDSRAKCLGLLAAFDLDVVMTSEREWGCYPEVPGLAIAQLARVDGIAAVLVTHWEWDGVTRTRVERPEPAGVAATETSGEGQEGLWDQTATSD